MNIIIFLKTNLFSETKRFEQTHILLNRIPRTTSYYATFDQSQSQSSAVVGVAFV